MNILFKNKLKEFHNRFLTLKGDPRKISMGMAIGVFVGVTPTIPFHTIIIIFLVTIFRQNLSAALLGMWIANPITLPFFYIAEYKLGTKLLGLEQCVINMTDYNISALICSGWNIFYPLQLGGLVLAPLFAVPAYFVTHKTIFAARIDDAGNNADKTSEKI
jgi:hypothetical protein